jgi:hypothetical protein
VGDQGADLLGMARGSSMPMIAPELLPKTSARPSPSIPTAASRRCASSPWTSIRCGSLGPSSGLRELPRRS